MAKGRASILATLFVLLACAARGQTVEPRNFGTLDEAIVVIPFHAFLPGTSSGTYNGINERYSIGALRAPMVVIPHGSVLDQLVFYIRDDDAANDFTGQLCWTFVNASTGQNLAPACTASVSSSGTPGESVVTLPLGVPILYRQDIDGDGTTDAVAYHLLVSTGSSDVALRMARLQYRREVSPAPAIATFGDVPTNHPLFQFVEALADSGITVGCGSGNYCPDAPLTRGQMAVFLAKALGLHWPWDAQ